MNFRNIMLASAATMFVASSAHADMMHPFGLPKAGHGSSTTKIETSRTKYKGDLNIEDSVQVSEELKYGITDKLSVIGVLVNDFDTEKEYNNDHNFEYSLGFAYDLTKDKVFAEVRAYYHTYDPEDYLSESTDRWQKSMEAGLKLGYDMGNGLTPYISYFLNSDIDTSDRELTNELFAGLHKDNGSWAVDAGLGYDFNLDGVNQDALYAKAELAYYPADKIAVSVYGDYYLNGNLYNYETPTETYKLDEDYTVGMTFKFSF